ncbi:HD domain-containing protein [Pseudodesulfovibrio sp.]|nr:HD domain-containing protein [Pseudodesulfovibrio sp.]
MPDESIQTYRDWFDAFVRDHQEKAGENRLLVERKQRHTMRVFDHVQAIIKESGASRELCHAMEIAALLHDVGRFPQLLDTNTYDDTAGFDHGEAGARILAESDLLDPLDIPMRGVVLSVVKYHNRGSLPKELGPDARLALEVVRDADKLDAIRNNLKYLSPDAPYGKALKSGLTWHDTEFSPQVFDLAMNRQLIPLDAIAWSNDFTLFLCCWLYDINFNYSFTHLKASGNFQALLDKLPDTTVFTPLKEQLWDDLNWIIVKS